MKRLILLILLLLAGCADFPTRFSLIEMEKVRLLDIKYEPAEAAPGDTVKLTATFAGKKVTSEMINWKVSYKVTPNTDTALEIKPLIFNPVQTRTTENTSCISLTFIIPDSVMYYSPMIKCKWIETLPSDYCDVIPDDFKNLSKAKLIDTVRYWQKTGLKGKEDLDLQNIEDLLKVLSVNIRIYAAIGNAFTTESNFTVRYNRAFNKLTNGIVKINNNPVIDSLLVYKVPGIDLSKYDPSEKKHISYRLYDEEHSPQTVIPIDRNCTYFLHSFTSGRDSSVSLAGNADCEEYHSRYFYQHDPKEIENISSDFFMYVSRNDNDTIYSLIPPFDEKIKSFTLWLKITDHFFNEYNRPQGSTLKEFIGKFDYTENNVQNKKNNDTIAPVLTLFGSDTIRVPSSDPDNLIGFYADYYEVHDDKDTLVKKGNKERVEVIRVFPVNAPGTFFIAYKAWDNAGNITQKTRCVIIYGPDIELPNITFETGDTIHVTVGSTFDKMHGVTAYDEVDKNITDKIEVTGDINTEKPDTFTLIYQVKDIAGNLATKARIIIVTNDFKKTDFPVITLKGYVDMVINHSQPYIEPGYVAHDSIDGDLTSNVTISVSPQPFDSLKPAPGVFKINYSVIDKDSNSTTSTRTLTVLLRDITPPEITILGKNPDTCSIGSVYNDKGAIANDSLDRDITNKIKTTNQVKTDKAGEYKVIYEVTDNSGNTTKAERIVIVDDNLRDTTPPVITITGKDPDTCSIDTVYNDMGATANDNLDGDITEKIKITNQVKIDKAGEYKVIYEVTDNSGNTAKAERMVIVKDNHRDTTPPVITITGKDPDTCIIDSVYNDNGATAYDSVDGDITDKIKTTNQVKTNKAGKYKVIYEVTDNSDNTTKTERTVVIIDYNASLLEKYGVPTSSSLPMVDTTFKNTEVDGTKAPDLSFLKEHTVNWNPNTKQLHLFSNQFTIDPWYYNHCNDSKFTYNFIQNGPIFTIKDTPFTAMNGEYYIKKDGDKLIWVRTNGSFAIIWKP